MDQVDEGLAAFVPTDADVESLAVYLYACMYESSFAGGKGRLWDSLPSEISYSWRRVARHAFDHAGYLPSVTAARRDALNTYTYERRQHATETAAWKDCCGNLEAQLKVSHRKRIDDWLPVGPDTALSIDSITRLIKVAHEVGDNDLLKLAGQAAKKLIILGLMSAGQA